MNIVPLLPDAARGAAARLDARAETLVERAEAANRRGGELLGQAEELFREAKSLDEQAQQALDDAAALQRGEGLLCTGKFLDHDTVVRHENRRCRVVEINNVNQDQTIVLPYGPEVQEAAPGDEEAEGEEPTLGA